jgi:hypothetical protein
MARKAVLLGSTGSIGVSTLDLFEASGAAVEILALTAGSNVALLAEQSLRWLPQIAVIADERLLPQLRQRLQCSGVQAAGGAGALAEAACMNADWVMAAIVGTAGLAPTLAQLALVQSSPWPIRKASSAPVRPYCRLRRLRAGSLFQSIPSIRRYFRPSPVKNRTACRA